MNNHFILNVSMKIPGSLCEIQDFIDLFKELGGSECLENTNIQRTVGMTEDRTYSATGITIEKTDATKHGRTVTFRMKIPFVKDTESPFKGYFVTPMKAASKYFDEFVQHKKPTPRVKLSSIYKGIPEGIEDADPVVDATIIKNSFYDINNERYAGYWETSCRRKWVKDPTL